MDNNGELGWLIRESPPTREDFDDLDAITTDRIGLRFQRNRANRPPPVKITAGNIAPFANHYGINRVSDKNAGDVIFLKIVHSN